MAGQPGQGKSTYNVPTVSLKGLKVGDRIVTRDGRIATCTKIKDNHAGYPYSFDIEDRTFFYLNENGKWVEDGINQFDAIAVEIIKEPVSTIDLRHVDPGTKVKLRYGRSWIFKGAIATNCDTYLVTEFDHPHTDYIVVERDGRCRNRPVSCDVVEIIKEPVTPTVNLKGIKVGTKVRLRSGEILEFVTKLENNCYMYQFKCSSGLLTGFTEEGYYWSGNTSHFSNIVEILEEPKSAQSTQTPITSCPLLSEIESLKKENKELKEKFKQIQKHLKELK